MKIPRSSEALKQIQEVENDEEEAKKGDQDILELCVTPAKMQSICQQKPQQEEEQFICQQGPKQSTLLPTRTKTVYTAAKKAEDFHG